MATNQPGPGTGESGIKPRSDDDVVSAAQNAAWWRQWAERGPQGPITDEPDDELPSEP